MAFDEKLADRVRQLLKDKREISEKRMFGGMAFMVKGKMCCGVLNDDLVARVGAENYEDALKVDHVRPMDFTGRPIKGYVYVGPKGTRTDLGLRKWVLQSVDFAALLAGKRKRTR